MSISPRKQNPCHGRYPNHWKIPALVLKSLHILSWSIQRLRMSNENLSCQGNYYAYAFSGPMLTWWQPSFWQVWTPSKLFLQNNLQPQPFSVLYNVLDIFLHTFQSSLTKKCQEIPVFDEIQYKYSTYVTLWTLFIAESSASYTRWWAFLLLTTWGFTLTVLQVFLCHVRLIFMSFQSLSNNHCICIWSVQLDQESLVSCCWF